MIPAHDEPDGVSLLFPCVDRSIRLRARLQHGQIPTEISVYETLLYRTLTEMLEIQSDRIEPMHGMDPPNFKVL